MAKKKKREMECLREYAKTYCMQPKFYDIVVPFFLFAFLLMAAGTIYYGADSLADHGKNDERFLTIEMAEAASFVAMGITFAGVALLMAAVVSFTRTSYETLRRLDDIKKVLIANADVLKGVDALKLDDIAPPPPPVLTAEQKYMKRFSSRDLSWGWWLLVVGVCLVGVLLMAASFATLNYPDFDSFVRHYVEKPQYLVLAGPLLVLGAGYVMMLRGLRLAKLAEKAENAKKGIDTEDASAECSSGQGGEDVRRSGSGGWWKDGDEGR